MSSPPQIFISYAREDFVVVKQLYHRLKGAGYKPWMDKVDLPKGAKFAEAIPKVLRESDLFIVCLSNHSVNKRSFIQREINLALDILEEKLGDDLYIFPVRLEACAAPDRISQFNWTDLFGDEHEEEWQALLAALSAQAKRLGKTPPPLPQTVIVATPEPKSTTPLPPPPTNPPFYIAPRDLEEDVPAPSRLHLIQSKAEETKEVGTALQKPLRADSTKRRPSTRQFILWPTAIVFVALLLITGQSIRTMYFAPKLTPTPTPIPSPTPASVPMPTTTPTAILSPTATLTKKATPSITVAPSPVLSAKPKQQPDESPKRVPQASDHIAEDEIVYPGTVHLRPNILYMPKANYTEQARQTRITGEIVLSIVFSADGTIGTIRVVRGLPDGLNEAAVKAAREIRFEPAMKDGKPVSVRMSLEYIFNLL